MMDKTPMSEKGTALLFVSMMVLILTGGVCFAGLVLRGFYLLITYGWSGAWNSGEALMAYFLWIGIVAVLLNIGVMKLVDRENSKEAAAVRARRRKPPA
jgi:hypothetical protein